MKSKMRKCQDCTRSIGVTAITQQHEAMQTISATYRGLPIIFRHEVWVCLECDHISLDEEQCRKVKIKRELEEAAIDANISLEGEL